MDYEAEMRQLLEGAGITDDETIYAAQDIAWRYADLRHNEGRWEGAQNERDSHTCEGE